jgi:hypothetical protein
MQSDAKEVAGNCPSGVNRNPAMVVLKVHDLLNKSRRPLTITKIIDQLALEEYFYSAKQIRKALALLEEQGYITSKERADAERRANHLKEYEWSEGVDQDAPYRQMLKTVFAHTADALFAHVPPDLILSTDLKGKTTGYTALLKDANTLFVKRNNDVFLSLGEGERLLNELHETIRWNQNCRITIGERVDKVIPCALRLQPSEIILQYLTVSGEINYIRLNEISGVMRDRSITGNQLSRRNQARQLLAQLPYFETDLSEPEEPQVTVHFNVEAQRLLQAADFPFETDFEKCADENGADFIKVRFHNIRVTEAFLRWLMQFLPYIVAVKHEKTSVGLKRMLNTAPLF